MANSKTKSRYFGILTYLPEQQLISCLESKASSVRAWAFIRHDKDDNASHIHLVIRTHSTWTPFQIQKWFYGTDDDGLEQNTFAEVVHDRTGIVDYLTHENDPTKYHYDKSDIVDHGLADILPAGETMDDSFEIVQRMLEGCSVREMVRLYGRDFVYHYGSYRAIVDQILTEENAR